MLVRCGVEGSRSRALSGSPAHYTTSRSRGALSLIHPVALEKDCKICASIQVFDAVGLTSLLVCKTYSRNLESMSEGYWGFIKCFSTPPLCS